MSKQQRQIWIYGTKNMKKKSYWSQEKIEFFVLDILAEFLKY